MGDFDKYAGFRDIILDQLGRCIDDILILFKQNKRHVFTESDQHCIVLTISLEKCITYGMKESTLFTTRDLYELIKQGSLSAKDEYLIQDFEISNGLLLTKIGKARAWIRKTMNQNHLATSIYALASNRQFIKSFYEEYAIMSTNRVNDLHKHIEKLQKIHFNFGLRDRILDDNAIYSLYVLLLYLFSIYI